MDFLKSSELFFHRKTVAHEYREHINYTFHIINRACELPKNQLNFYHGYSVHELSKSYQLFFLKI
jgi:hypothetical protein